ncbi:MAG: hypothetical protein RL735_723 [Pseudomonadota bacterium]|jgi:uncharacterized protein YcgI (DUF1989 family)
MTYKTVWDKSLPRNVGFCFELKEGQFVKLTSQTIIDLVCFNLHNLRERFDQARTKANQRKVFISTGDCLVSKLNNTMATIVEDTFKEGHHDLQEGMCSRKRHELAAARGMWEKTYGRPLTEMPTHGCTENLSGILAPYGVAMEDIPSPFNIFQDMIIRPDGELVHSHVRPQAPGGWLILRADMDLLVAISVCPDSSIGGKTGASLAVLEAA